MAATEHYGVNAPLRQAGAAHTLAPTGYMRSPLVVACQDRVQLAAGVEVGSKVYLGDVDWDFIPDADLSKIHFDAAGAGVTLDIGDANDADAFANDLAINAAGSGSLLVAVDRANYGKRMWELLGYASKAAAQATRDKARLYATIGGANLGAATDLFWRLVGVNA